MTIENVIPLDGQHCETTTIGTLLLQLNITLSEPMLFGLGEGLSFYLWELESMILPFVSGRVRPGFLTQNLAKNLNLKLTVCEDASPQKAWAKVKELLDSRHVVGLKLDCYYLEYFTRPYHFAEHFVAIYGYNDVDAFLIDTTQQGGKVKTSLKSLVLARAEKGPMASNNMYFTLEKTNRQFDLKAAIISAIKNNASNYLNPDISTDGYIGILTLSSQIIDWFKQGKDIENGFKSSAKLMEKAGTGGAIFRNLYRDFLKESYDLLHLDKLKFAYDEFVEIASLWTAVSNLFELTSKTKDFNCIQEASEILKRIAAKEKGAMAVLLTL